MKKALITGVTGQDGSYLTEFLIGKGYEVHGIKRRSSSLNTSRIDHIYEEPQKLDKKLFLHYGDLSDTSSLLNIISKVMPDEIYNLAAQSHVSVSFDIPEYTADINAIGTLRILECIRNLNLHDKCKFYQASSSELFGEVQEKPQNENTPFYPKSPYAVAKLFAYWITKNYRESYNIFACNGILFNHESERRGETFVTRKITRTLARIKYGIEKCLYLGNLDALRDWGHAKDYVEMQWLMLQQKKPKDYVIATGNAYSVREFVSKAALSFGFEIEWEGSGPDEVGVISNVLSNGKTNLSIGDIIVRIDKKYLRPSEVNSLLGEAKKARDDLEWEPKINFDELVSLMVKSDEILTKNELKKI